MGKKLSRAQLRVLFLMNESEGATLEYHDLARSWGGGYFLRTADNIIRVNERTAQAIIQAGVLTYNGKGDAWYIRDVYELNDTGRAALAEAEREAKAR